MELKGAITALVTPFINNEIDEEGLIANIRYQIKEGINGILVLGATGEAPTITPTEQSKVISMTIKAAKGKVPIWVGTGSNCTRKTIEKTNQAQELGADVALIVTPYYNKPTQEGIYRHFEEISKCVSIPIVVYNPIGRCGVNIETQTLLRIAGLPHIIGVKDSSGNIEQAAEVMHAVVKKYPQFLLFSSDDALTLPFMALGGAGVVSVVSNLLPASVVALTQAALKGDFQKARELHEALFPLFQWVFIETNPIPIKTAMSLCGMAAGECRLPLCCMTPQNKESLRRILLDVNHPSLKGEAVRT